MLDELRGAGRARNAVASSSAVIPGRPGTVRIRRERADHALDRPDRVLGATVRERARGGPADEQLTVDECRDARYVLAELAIFVERHDGMPAVLDGRDHGPRGPEIDAEPHGRAA